MNRHRCSELLDILLSKRGRRKDAGDNFLVSLPYSCGSQCRRAICTLHELFTGESIELTSTIFTRSKKELEFSGVGRLQFHSDKVLDESWVRFDPSDWRCTIDTLTAARERSIPKHFQVGGLLFSPSDFASHELVLLTVEQRSGVPSADKDEVDKIKKQILRAHQIASAAVAARA